jgi:hypothetical protein
VVSPVGKRWIRIVLVAVTAWFAATMAFWANKPLHDYAPTGVVPNAATADPDDTVETSIRVTCGSPWSANRDEPLPALEPPLAYQDTPCSATHRDARIVLFLNIAVFALAVGAGVFLLTRRSPVDAQPSPAIA